MMKTFTRKQREILVKLTCIYYAAGDIKNLWEDEDLLAAFKLAFNISTEEEVELTLNKLAYIFQDPTSLTIKYSIKP